MPTIMLYYKRSNKIFFDLQVELTKIEMIFITTLSIIFDKYSNWGWQWKNIAQILALIHNHFKL